jgi:uncharacterized protein
MRGLQRAQTAVFLPLLAARFVFLNVPSRAERVQDLPQPTDYVSDLAHVLSPEAIARIDSICAQLDHSQANAKIAVVTIHTLAGDDSADYANQLEDHWKMGDKGLNRYAMVLLAVDDHQRRIEIGYGLEGILNDAKAGDIGREMVPDLRANDFDGAVLLAVGEIAQDIAADAKVTLNQDEPMPMSSRPEHQGSPLGKLILIIIVMVLFGGGSLLRMLFGFGLFFGGWGGGTWRGGGGVGGGGGFGGGSGGGFSGFGGSGGGFGGGGAGGSW